MIYRKEPQRLTITKGELVEEIIGYCSYYLVPCMIQTNYYVYIQVSENKLLRAIAHLAEGHYINVAQDVDEKGKKICIVGQAPARLYIPGQTDMPSEWDEVSF